MTSSALEVDTLEMAGFSKKEMPPPRRYCRHCTLTLKCCGICCFVYWLLTAILFAVLVAAARKVQTFSVFQRLNSSTIIGHRGSIGLFPESTLFTFENALALGMDAIECDLRQTKDGHIVLLHDETTTRTTQRSSKVQELTLEEVKELDAGWWWSTGARYARGPGGDTVEWTTFPYRSLGIQIPTLIETFERFPNVLKIIELKTESNSGTGTSTTVPEFVISETCSLIQRYKQEHLVVVASFSEDALIRFRQLCSNEIATGTGVQGVASMWVASLFGGQAAFSPPGPSIQAPTFFRLPVLGKVEVLTASFLNAAKERGVTVGAYDIDDAVVYQQLLDRGLNGGVITDRIDVLLSAAGRLPLDQVSTLADLKSVGTSCGCQQTKTRLHTAKGCATVLNLSSLSSYWRVNLTEFIVTCPTQKEVMDVPKEDRWELFDNPGCGDGCSAADYCLDEHGEDVTPCCLKRIPNVPIVVNRTIGVLQGCVNDTKMWSGAAPAHVQDEKSLLL